MKKLFLKLIVVMFTTIICTGFISCGGDDNDIHENSTNPIDPVEPSKDDNMSPEDRKEYLETVALEFMDMMPASDFRDISELGKYINDTYLQNYNWENVEEWAEDIFNALRESTGQTTESETESWGDYLYKYNYFYTNYKVLLTASNFTGHFTALNGHWVLEKANDLQFVFKDKNGKQCILKLETSGNIKKVHAYDIDDWKDYDYYYDVSDNSYINNEYYDRTQCTIGVPERIEVTLTQNGNQIVKTTVKINLDNINGEEFDISKNDLTTSVLIELNNGYKFDFSNIVYSANTKASVSFIMSKNGRPLLTMGAAADLNDLPSVNLSAFSSQSFDIDDYCFDDASVKNGYVKVDVIGKVQIQGSISDVRKYVNCLQKADDNYTYETTFKSYINQANAITDIFVFYDGKNTKQAEVRLESFYSGYSWDAEPVIYFYDGSSYSTFKAYINENDFTKAIDTFKRLANKYADLIDERIKWR